MQNLPDKCSLDVCTSVGVFLTLADLLWRGITDGEQFYGVEVMVSSRTDEYNQLVVVKITQHVIKLLAWYESESSAVELLCTQFFDRILEKALQVRKRVTRYGSSRACSLTHH